MFETGPHSVNVLDALKGELDVFVVLRLVPFTAGLNRKKIINIYEKCRINYEVF
jgi:hypothetical protein